MWNLKERFKLAVRKLPKLLILGIVIFSVPLLLFLFGPKQSPKTEVTEKKNTQQTSAKHSSPIPAQENKKFSKGWIYRLEKNPNTIGINPEERVLCLPAMISHDEEGDFLSFTVFHTEPDGNMEPTLFIINKSTNKGSWTQEKPLGKGLCQLKKIQTITGGYCLRISSGDFPDDWNDAYLIPQ
jgi:hypothetical protein